MHVKDILRQVSYISSGLDDPSDLSVVDSSNINAPENIDIRIYLQHLNLIHLELYRLTAMYNPAISVNKKEAMLEKGISKIPHFNYYTVSCIYDKTHNTKLVQSNISEIIENDPLGRGLDTPKCWYNNGNQINVYPKPNSNLDLIVWYKEAPQVFTIETQEEEIPYPSFYHQVLVDGASYYVFQSETGLKNQSELSLANARWEKGKQELLNYFMNTAGLSYKSTCSGI